MRYLLPLLLALCGFLSPAMAAEQDKADNYGYYELEPDIITNYVGQAGHLGYIKVTVQLMLKDKDKLDLVDHHAPLIRDALIEILGKQNADDIRSLQGREQIRKACLKATQDLLQKEAGEPLVADLLFTKYLYY
ncbi:flagellar basal body-associated protein FliL [Gallaecimonas kandeliae]|uniref:flagellar basal body-associated protein FliL n=1 Tax=Gallaecimonas kandeliae TaxID=3029055 RepID=UPI002647FE55|nr:flagellar basal body-associated protein FliL [Gallaecimonas kandeliae]WKE65828.1 flagellar basal body-associated protein FliL [Gallaecimonas kandeliae]